MHKVVEGRQSRGTSRDGSFHLEQVLCDDVDGINGVPHHICDEVEGREWEREEK